MSEDNDLLEELLQDATPETSPDNPEEDKILAPLLAEIDLIDDGAVKHFVRQVLLSADPHFWTIPSSFSGKHHPADEHGEGGNVLHTKRVVRACKLICESQERGPFETDIMIAAAILHDLTKGIKKGEEFEYDPLHPYTVDWRALKVDTVLEDEFVQQILRLIRTHLGIWSPIPETIPMSSLEWSLHLADNLASKMHWIMDGPT